MKIWMLCLVGIVPIAGCMLVGCKKPWVNIVTENNSASSVEDVRIRFGEFTYSSGNIRKDMSASYVDYSHPITEETEVHWNVENVHKQQNVSLRGIYKKGSSGTLTFTISDKTVEARFKEEPRPRP